MANATLTTLPTEIIRAICATMCRHCCTTGLVWSDSVLYGHRKSDLKRLSETCRRLRDIAQPVLFHNINPKDLLPLLRTIIERPDLAVHIRGFSNHDSKTSLPSNDDVERLEAAARRLGIDRGEGWLKEIQIDEVARYTWPLDFILSHIPYIVAMYLVLPNISEEKELGNLIEGKVVMPHVRCLYVTDGDHEDGMVNLGDMCALLAMMPNIQKLDVYHCEGATQHIPLAELRSLSITTANIGVSSLRRIVESCPKLESFEYEGSTRERYIETDELEITWGEAQRILHQRRTTLKHLNFEFGIDYLDLREEPMMLEDHPGSFRDFDKLETLFVRTTSLGAQWSFEETPTFPATVQDLVDMLPESLTLLAFCGRHCRWRGLEKLAQAIRDGHFPKLTTVLVEQEGEDFNESRADLAAVGVVCIEYEDNRTCFGDYATVTLDIELERTQD